jgi:hypothetical protein
MVPAEVWARRSTGGRTLTPAPWVMKQSEGRTMTRSQFTPSSCPVVPRPDPVLLFIQQAQLSLVYAAGSR